MDLLVSIDTIGRQVVVAPRGQADLSSVPLLHGGLQRAIVDHPGRRLVVDLDGLVALDDVALGVLLGAATRARDLGGDLAVLCTNARVVDRLRTTRFDRVVDVLDSLGEEPSDRPLEPPRPGVRDAPEGVVETANDGDHPQPTEATTPTSDGYVAVIFTNRRTDADPEGYSQAADRMERLAAEQPGFRGIETVRGADGVGITVSYWDSDADARAWKANHEHLDAQRAGRARWYSWYRLRVATVEREYAYDPDHEPADLDRDR